MKSRRKFSKDFKQAAVTRLNGGQSVAEVARALEVHPSDLHRWRRELQDYGACAFSGGGKKRAEESRVAELERKVGQQAMEIDFFKSALFRIRHARQATDRSGVNASTKPSGRGRKNKATN